MDENSSKYDLMAVLESPVVDDSGEPLGKIAELIVDQDEGHIEYAKLWLEVESPHRPEVIVPWSQFDLSPSRTHLELNISLPVLRAAAVRPRSH